jgi:hypothetical protein
MTNENPSREDQLTGQAHYVGWYNKLISKLEQKGFMNENEEIIRTTGLNPVFQERSAYNLILINCSMLLLQKCRVIKRQQIF